MAVIGGVIGGILRMFFPRDQNVLRETVEVFRENAEASAQRAQLERSEALRQFAAEFREAQRSRFDRLMDALNRLPRPMLALGTLALLTSAMADPAWFAARMQGLALVPEPLWWLLGVIVSFYFGARHQIKSQEFQRALVQTLVRLPDSTPVVPDDRSGQRTQADMIGHSNPALEAWRQSDMQR